MKRKTKRIIQKLLGSKEILLNPVQIRFIKNLVSDYQFKLTQGDSLELEDLQRFILCTTILEELR